MAKSFNKGLSLKEKMALKIKQSGASTSAEQIKTASPEVKTQSQVPSEKQVKASAVNILNAQQSLSNTDSKVQLIDLELIDIEAQVRTNFDPDYIEDLATDFAISDTKQPNQPITVWQRANGRYLLDDGENRYRAMKVASENRTALGVKDLSAFSMIRATVRGAEPSKLERVQSQAKANLLRDNLNDVEVGRAALLFLKENPKSSHTDVAKWLGFQKAASGRVKISNALKLLECDDDLVASVESNEIAASRALIIQDERKKESSQTGKITNKTAQTTKSIKSLSKAKSGKKAINLSVDINALKLAAKLIERLASEKSLETDWLQGDDRKTITGIFKEDKLQGMLDKLDE